jgi:multiple sugar transport system substrate-binding protein
VFGRCVVLAALFLSVFFIGGCNGQPPGPGVTVVFKHAKLFGDPEPLDRLIGRFEAENPGIRVRRETLPSGSDSQHQFYVINLRAKSRAFDVFAVDVIWGQEFARAGWLTDLDDLLPAARRGAFFSGPIRAASYRGHLWAVPWFIDAGVLYYRRDLLARYGFSPPKTWDELVHAARTIAPREGVYGFLWQGKQYEGLVCNIMEYLWSGGGAVLDGGRVVLDSPANRGALGFVRRLITPEAVTPEFVSTLTEEPSRRIFGDGRALFLRSWPYAWNLFQRPDSPVRGRVGVSALPHFPGHGSASTLGGWLLAINPHSRHPRAARRFLRFITSPAAQKALALAYGFQPTRKALYEDADLLRAQPFLGELHDIFRHARPRPLTPLYVSVSQILQSQFSAAVAGVRPPAEALRDGQTALEALFRRWPG